MKYEYKIIKVDVSKLRKDRFQLELNKKFSHWGSLGWDLVTSDAVQDTGFWGYGSYTKEFIMIFKRTIRESLST